MLLRMKLIIHLRIDLSFIYEPPDEMSGGLFYCESVSVPSALAIASALIFLLSLSTWLYTLLVVKEQTGTTVPQVMETYLPQTVLAEHYREMV